MPTMSYERLTATDASFLHIESPHEPQHVGSLSYLEGAPLRDASGGIAIDELRSSALRRLHRVPVLRQRLMFVPYGLGRPIWVDDDQFDIGYHIRLTAVPRPGADDQVHELMSQLQSLPLDRQRPLWEMWFVDGLQDDEVGLIIKSHHALGDGIATVDVALAFVDFEPDPPEDPPAPAWEPEPAPQPIRLLVDSVADQLVRPAALAGAAFRHPAKALSTATAAGRAATSLFVHPEPAPWNVPVTTHRRWVSATVPLDPVRRVCERQEVTINDVVLEACTGALRDYLLSHDEDVDRTLRAVVPVSRRQDAEHEGTLGNKVSLIMIDLPVDEDAPLQRLERIHAAADELKGSDFADGAETIVTQAGEISVLSGPLARLGSRLIKMNVVITNIPGPPMPFYVRGARVLRAFPYVEVIDNEGLTIAVLSYDDHLFFGLTADRDVMVDLEVLARGIETSATRLAEAVEISGRPVPS
jgi:diacylglycerol O-acyltransferase / wax synthase